MNKDQEPAEPDAKGPEVIVRRMRFDLDEGLPRYWHSDSPYLTHLFSALSIVFPEGERFFIDSVRYFEKGLQDPGLREEVRAFALVGVLGSFTTFSTYGLETVGLATEGAFLQAGANVAASNVFGVLGVWLGYRLARGFVGV